MVPTEVITIQDAIDIAQPGDTVLVEPGVYTERINFLGKEILVGSLHLMTGLNNYIIQTVLDGENQGTVVTFNSGEGNGSQLQGLTIRNGSANNGGGVYCSGASPTLANLVITQNTATSRGGGMICYYNSEPRMRNVTITANTAGQSGGALFCRDSSNPLILNSIFWNNTPQEVALYLNGAVTVAYSDMQGGELGIQGENSELIHWLEGNIDLTPLFLSASSGDLSLQDGSPCVDMGTAYFAIGEEVILDLSPSEYFGLAPDMGALEFQIIHGCTDPEAANFNPEATVENGTCVYAPIMGELDDQQLAEDTTLTITLTAVDYDLDPLFYSAQSDAVQLVTAVNGNQLNLIPQPNWNGLANIYITVTDGEYSDAGEFQVIVTPTNDPPVIDDIPDLTMMENDTSWVSLFAYDIDNTQLVFDADCPPQVTDCTVIGTELRIVPEPHWYGLDSIVVSVTDQIDSDETTFNLEVLSNNDDVWISVGTIDYLSNIIEIQITNETDISGFQFTVSGANITDAHSGIAEQLGFVVYPSLGTGVVIGFSEFGATIPPGTYPLTLLEYEAETGFDICLDDVIFMMNEIDEAYSQVAECIAMGELGYGLLGDLDQDGMISVLDIVLQVDMVLGNSVGSFYQQWAADIDQDTVVNIVDVLQLIQLILNH